MLKYALIAALLLPGVANARTWYAAKQGNQCITSPFTPQEIIDVFAHQGNILTPKLSKLSSGGSVVMLHDEKDDTGALLFTSMQDCKNAVKMAIASGVSVDPDELK